MQQKPAVKRSRVENSMLKLVPSFRAKVLQLLALMRAEGFRPIVWETYRSPERAAQLAATGEGVLLSQHSLGLAVDILDADTLWSLSAAFKEALHRHALELGLGRVKHRDKNGHVDWDWAHVQALPGAFDAKMRALLTESKRDDYLRARYA